MLAGEKNVHRLCAYAVKKDTKSEALEAMDVYKSPQRKGLGLLITLRSAEDPASRWKGEKI